VSRIDEVLGHALTRKPMPIVWDEVSAEPTVETLVEEEFSARTARRVSAAGGYRAPDRRVDRSSAH
jgi:hypothetical protein